ncbi:glycerol-3-phosphate acyltransferase 3-like [Ptychodera flava]|uniref:glycerol-3-phosphate acyltransferase 3-like n=1 Tax=Ptychodera flava TaxID=63121 RepID=UPI00396A1E7B
MDQQLFFLVLGFTLTPLMAFYAMVIIPAALGIEVGVRRIYVTTLLKIFEWGKQRIARANENSGGGVVRNGTVVTAQELIERNGPKSLTEAVAGENGSIERKLKHDFHLSDICYFLKGGVESIIDDDVTKRFDAEELSSWNLLTRTNQNYQHLSLRLTVLWGLGFVIRYFILLPFRLSLLVIGISWCMLSYAVIGYLPRGKLKRSIYWYISTVTNRILGRSLSACVTYHNKEYRAAGGGICVANHTSPIDVIILGGNNCYAMIGQRQGGFFGMMQRAFSRAESHIWFDRSEMKDRQAVSRRMKDHVEDPNKLPILIFPEGTCINNTSVMMFKKGCFEIGGTIYPVAIKYDPRFGDAFWNSSKYSLLEYLVMMFSSWALVCDVWYLPPMTQQENETAVEFAGRVKAAIAKQGGLLDLVWDGQLKRQQVKSSFKEEKQAEYSKLITGE